MIGDIFKKQLFQNYTIFEKSHRSIDLTYHKQKVHQLFLTPRRMCCCLHRIFHNCHSFLSNTKCCHSQPPRFLLRTNGLKNNFYQTYKYLINRFTKQNPLTQMSFESCVHLVPSITCGFNKAKLDLSSGLQNKVHFFLGSMKHRQYQVNFDLQLSYDGKPWE